MRDDVIEPTPLGTPPSFNRPIGPVENSGKATASLVFGILAMFCWVFTSIPALIFGGLAMRDINKSGGRVGGSGQAIAGMILGGIFTFVPVVFLLMVAILLPAIMAARGAARTAQSTNNLRTVALTALQYHESQKHFPSPVVGPEAGEAPRSWRAELLPYVEEATTYDVYQKDLEWNDPANHKAADVNVPSYQSALDGGPTEARTNYFAVVGDGFIMNNERPTPIQRVRDGSSNTIIFVEYVPSEVRWAEPRDLTLEEYAAYIADPKNDPGSRGFLVAFADGTVQKLKAGIPIEELRALFTISGGEPMNPGVLMGSP